MKSKYKILSIIIISIVLVSTTILIRNSRNIEELQQIKSKSELQRIYKGDDITDFKEGLLKIFAMPFSINSWLEKCYDYYNDDESKIDNTTNSNLKSILPRMESDPVSTVQDSSKIEKDYSTTNIQVENVDEADVTKTDGDYIYSISESKVIITDVRNPKEIKVAAEINFNDNSMPEDLILTKEKLIIISESEYTSLYSEKNTIVRIYDIQDRTSPNLLKEYKMFEPYYTSRCIDNKLYVISSGNLRENEDEKNEIDTYYIEDSTRKEIKLSDIKYLKDIKTKKQTIISTVDLYDVKQDVNLNSYLIDVSNAYVSENNIYLLYNDYKLLYNDYKNEYEYRIKDIFGVKGILGIKENEDENLGEGTNIFKFNILENGQIKYQTKTLVKGKTVDQYSLDEKDGHLRIALKDTEGTRVAILDNNLRTIGETERLAKGEKMYSSRFVGDKAYLVTYKTVDPLFTIDLSNEENPKVLGQLKIPGYSNYIHPYDENHIIGIGIETEEEIRRDSNGKVISNTAKIIGMKMALFDVSDVNNPRQISNTIIGDRRTTSAVLTNPKALLFSKEKELIAIPVNNYVEDFEAELNEKTYDSMQTLYTSREDSRISEGYAVYKINIEEGFKLKGIIKHDVKKRDKYNYYSYRVSSKLLRGLYIDNNLYTVSETAIKVNDLETLEQISEIKID